MVNALSSSYQCPSIGFRQMVPPLPTSGSHPAAFRARLVDPLVKKLAFYVGSELHFAPLSCTSALILPVLAPHWCCTTIAGLVCYALAFFHRFTSSPKPDVTSL